MQLRNSSARYGWVSMVLHWGVALVCLAQRRARLAQEHWHHAVRHHAGAYCLAPGQPTAATAGRYSRMTRIGAAFGHAFLYLGLFAVMIAGYLISTADGVGIPVFGLFEIPAVVSGLPDQADNAGLVHLYLAWVLVVFAGLHGVGCVETPLYRS
ncbi:cytochrome b561 like protein 2 [Ditylenchus destructor]|nr:cytochrome b561 like protein 2 [Ditylenchus destructor]